MSKKLTNEEFIKRSKKIHKEKYNYSLVNYIDNTTKVKIICEEHGVFEQKPIYHMNGSGCPKCCRNYKLTKEEFINRSKNIYGNLYDYSLVNFKNVSTKVKIICKKHGIFE